MLWHEWVVLIARSTGSALRAVRPPNLHITPVVRRDLDYRASATGSLYRSPLSMASPDFNALHSGKQTGEVQLCTFDVLAIDGDGVRDLPLSMRKATRASIAGQYHDTWQPPLAKSLAKMPHQSSTNFSRLTAPLTSPTWHRPRIHGRFSKGCATRGWLADNLMGGSK
jgi:hypothetical protein